MSGRTRTSPAAAAARRKAADRLLDAPLGARIDRLRAQGAERCSVCVAGRSVCTLPRRVLEAMGVRVGVEWSPRLARALAGAVEEDRARRAALRLLAVRPRSRGELQDRLRRAGVADDLAARIIGDLVSAGAVNDRAFARLMASSIVSRKPAGARLIQRTLRAKRIDPETARLAAAGALEGRDALADATDLARRRAATMRSLSEQARCRRLLGLLARRGFEPAVCREAVRAALGMREAPGEPE